jgi:hypothetical protein
MGSFSDTPSLAAGGTILPYRAVKVSARNTGIVAAANTDFIVGVTDGSTRNFSSSNHAETGDAISLQGGAIVLVLANGNSVNIAAGDLLLATTAGAFVKGTAATSTFAASRAWYVALEPAAADGLIVRAMRLGAAVVATVAT